MRILIDARLSPGVVGGVQQGILGLAKSLNDDVCKDIFSTWLVYDDSISWIENSFPANANVLELRKPHNFVPKALQNKIPKAIKELMRSTKALQPLMSRPGFIKESDYDLVHFPRQFGFFWKGPSVFQPHDLQHRYLPNFFTKQEFQRIEQRLSLLLKQSTRVPLGSRHALSTFRSNFPDFEDKFSFLPLAIQELNVTRVQNQQVKAYTPYLLYPANGWKHKNHVNLIRAFKIVTKIHKDLKLILTGEYLIQNKELNNEIRLLGIEENVKLLGFVPASHLAALYSGASAILVPSLFESASFPIWEAAKFDKIFVVSDIEQFRDQVLGPGAFFDPTDPKHMAEKILEVLDNPKSALQSLFATKKRLELLTWKNLGLGWRFEYRRALNEREDTNDRQWRQIISKF